MPTQMRGTKAGPCSAAAGSTMEMLVVIRPTYVLRGHGWGGGEQADINRGSSGCRLTSTVWVQDRPANYTPLHTHPPHTPRTV